MSYNIEETTLDISNYIENTSKKRKSKGQLKQISKDITQLVLDQKNIQNMTIDITKSRDENQELLAVIYVREVFNNLTKLNNGEKILVVLDIGIKINGMIRTFLVTISTGSLPRDYSDVITNMFSPNKGENIVGVFNNGRTFAAYSLSTSGGGKLFQLVSFCKEGGMLDYDQHYITVEQTQNPNIKNKAMYEYESTEILPKLLDVINKTSHSVDTKTSKESLHPDFYIPKNATLFTAVEYKSTKNSVLGEKTPYLASHLINLDDPYSKLYIFERQIGDLKKKKDDDLKKKDKEEKDKRGFLSQVSVNKNRYEKKLNLENKKIRLKIAPITKDIVLTNESTGVVTSLSVKGELSIMEYKETRYYVKNHMGGRLFLTHEQGYANLYRFHNEPSYLLGEKSKEIKKTIENLCDLKDNELITLSYKEQGARIRGTRTEEQKKERTNHDLFYVLYLDLYIDRIEEWHKEDIEKKQHVYFLENDNDFYLQTKYAGNVNKIVDAFLDSLTKEDAVEWCDVIKKNFITKAPTDFVDLSKDIKSNMGKTWVLKKGIKEPPEHMINVSSKWLILDEDFKVVDIKKEIEVEEVRSNEPTLVEEKDFNYSFATRHQLALEAYKEGGEAWMSCDALDNITYGLSILYEDGNWDLPLLYEDLNKKDKKRVKEIVKNSSLCKDILKGIKINESEDN